MLTMAQWRLKAATIGDNIDCSYRYRQHRQIVDFCLSLFPAGLAKRSAAVHTYRGPKSLLVCFSAVFPSSGDEIDCR